MSITGANNPFSCTPVVFSAANQILQLGTITRDGNEFTFSVGFVWKINGVTYQNTAPVVLTVAEASEGFYRIDNAILNTSNSIELQQGLESETIALQPVVPDTNILLTSWNISGDTIGDEETPLVGTQFKQKNENQKFNPTLGGASAVITIQPFGQNHYSVVGPVTGIVGFSKALITASPTAEVPYAGKDFYFENKTDHDVTLKDTFSPVDIPFNLGADLVVPTNGIVWLKYNPSTEKMDLFFKSWGEVDLSTKADLVDGKVPASQLPSYVDDVLEFANLAAFPVTGETGKIYVDLSTNLQYRWSGSVYISFSSKEKVIFYNRSTWTFPNVAGAPFPLISSTNFEVNTANLNSATDNALTAMNNTSVVFVPIGVAPFGMKLKRVILEGRQTFASWQGFNLRCVIGSNRTEQAATISYSHLDSQVVEDFTHSMATPINSSNLFVNRAVTSSVVIPQNHGVILMMSYSRTGTSISPVISTYLEFEKE